jgi:hypothetical protein
MTIYYWISVTFTLIAFGVCCSEAFVFDKYANDHHNIIFDCWYDLSLAFTVAITMVDVVSDLMSTLFIETVSTNLKTDLWAVISIPILLLRSSTLKTSQKLSVGASLCLSVFMVVFSTIRASGYVKKGSCTPDTLWRVFWQQIGGCVAVMMASITVVRTLFTAGDQNHNDADQEQCHRPRFLTRLLPRLSSNKKTTALTRESVPKYVAESSYIELRNMPLATFSSIRSFIRKHQRTGPVSTIAVSTFAESEFDPIEADYHAQIRASSTRHGV